MKRTTMVWGAVILLLVLVIIILLLTRKSPTFITDAHEGAYPGELTLETCEYKTKAGSEYRTECGTLVVNEDHDDPNSRLVEIPIKVIHSHSESPLEPIFIFGGGPGASNMGHKPQDAWLAEHDVVLVGYRGADGNTVLQCPEIQKVFRSSRNPVNSNAFLDEMGTAAEKCQQNIREQGVDLSQYRLDTVVEDFELARQKLGYEKINLQAESYGTRVTQIYAAMYPESIHRSVMIGVNPPGYFEWDQDVTQQKLEDYNDLCAKTEACQTDNLAESMMNASQNVPDRWFLFPIDMGAVRSISFVFMFNRLQSPAIIDTYLRAENGDYSGFAMMTLMYRLAMPNVFILGDLFAKGGSADCDASRDYRSEFEYDGSTAIGNPISRMIWGSMQDKWQCHLMSEDLRQTHPSSIETLLVNGTLDISTPVQNGRSKLLPTLENGYLVELENQGHVSDVYVVEREATNHLLTTFYRTGEVDDSQYVDAPWEYRMGMSYATMMKLIAFIPPVMIVVLGWLFVNRIKGKKKRKNS